MANGNLLSVIGAGAGAGIGAAFGNPMLGARLGSAGGSLLGSVIQGGKAQQAAPPLEDPRQRQFLDELNRRRRAFETGSAMQPERRALSQQQSALARGISRASLGSSGAAISGLSRLQRTTGAALNDIFARARQQQNFMTQMSLDLTNRMAQRKLDLQNLQQSRALAQSNRMQREGTSSLLNILASQLPLGGQGMGGGQPFMGQDQFSGSLSQITQQPVTLR